MATEGRASMLEAPGEAAVVREIVVDDPGPGEVLVRLVASGVCHTDLTVKHLKGSGMAFPIVLGHEGAGYVDKVGEGVTGLHPGDPVVLAYRAPCGQCHGSFPRIAAGTSHFGPMLFWHAVPIPIVAYFLVKEQRRLRVRRQWKIPAYP